MDTDILLVEDDVDLRRLMAEILVEEGYTVAEANDGEEAFELLRQLGPPRLILLDLMLPRMSGRELRARLLEDPVLSRVPVVVVTAYGFGTGEQSLLHAQGWLLKPVLRERLLRTAQHHCRRGAQGPRGGTAPVLTGVGRAHAPPAAAPGPRGGSGGT